MTTRNISDKTITYNTLMETTKLINMQIGRNQFFIEQDPDSDNAHNLRKQNEEWEAICDRIYKDCFGW